MIKPNGPAGLQTEIEAMKAIKELQEDIAHYEALKRASQTQFTAP